ncbi:SUKH-3 domain-containing protein [Streptomyces huiliensis]|uniref:SUKH-3 domain-containing protein n=1 Tax=Streptomyces huiliensis TaxID=2876027 RepID=UPI001CBC7637|nr:SUKH-3 domain-containing protein [Streptomyces huiliensis]MBZ4322191.1 SUKH-3 domain-containing protein [Streptomyces huiliensis]
MPPRKSPAEIEAWLGENGWFPERDIGRDADDAIAGREANLRDQGYPMTAPEVVRAFLHSYGLLELPYPNDPELILCLNPELAYQYDGSDIQELAEGLGVSVFPVGYETDEGAIVVMDEKERFFYIHDTGFYYMGQGVIDALATRLVGDVLQDAEDFYA